MFSFFQIVGGTVKAAVVHPIRIKKSPKALPMDRSGRQRSSLSSLRIAIARIDKA